MLPEDKDVVCGRHQTPCHAPLTRVNVSHARVASRLERGECSLFTDVASRALRLSVHPNPRPQQSACPRRRVLLAVAVPIQPERTAEPSASWASGGASE